MSPEAGGEDRAGVLLPDVEGRADMARTLPEGDPRYVTDFLPRMDGAGCPLGAGRLGFTYDGLSPRLCRNYVLQSSLDYAGLRGEGSIPVPLPPPLRLSKNDL